jgi:hypothetical protein
MKIHHKQLGLHQEVLLLALNDKKGTIFSGTFYGLSVAGAILSELLLQNRVEIETEGKKSFLKLVDEKTTGDEILDEAIQKVSTAKRRGSLETWVSRLASLKNLRHRIARQLCDKKILRANERQVLFFFKQRIYPERDHGPEKEIIARLNGVIFSSGRDADPRTIVLLSLVNSSGLLDKLFDRKRLKSRKAHIESLIQGVTLGDATKKAIQGAQAAIMVATMVPLIASTAVHH